MRYTVADLPKAVRQHGLVESLQAWWIELPLHNGWWWRNLFFEPGQGWLRWGTDRREHYRGYLDPPEPYVVAPPLRRLAMAIRWRATWPFEMKDEERLR